MKKYIKTLLATVLRPRRLQSLRAFIRASAIHNQHPVVRQPERGKIVVLAPHMDDEVLGCGGTIARHVQTGADVSVIFLTDGRYGSGAVAALTEPERGLRRRELMETRKQEAQRAAEVLGVNSLVFLDAEDGRLRNDLSVPQRLRSILSREPPAIVYVPFFLENHTDHCAATQVLMDASSGTRLDFECRCYEVWTPLFPNIVVEIDSTMELKRRALSCYASQLADMDYIHTSAGLNAYRSSAIGCKTARFVEAFLSLPLADYRRLYQAVGRFL